MENGTILRLFAYIQILKQNLNAKIMDILFQFLFFNPFLNLSFLLKQCSDLSIEECRKCENEGCQYQDYLQCAVGNTLSCNTKEMCESQGACSDKAIHFNRYLCPNQIYQDFVDPN